MLRKSSARPVSLHDIAYLRHALETKLLDPETRQQIEIVLAEHQKQLS